MPPPDPEDRRILIVRAQAWTCALPLEDVEETMRPLPVTPVAGTPEFVRGVSVVRGVSAPVVSLAVLLGGSGGAGQRFVSLRLPARRLVLEVDEVVGLRRMKPHMLQAAPPLLRGASHGQLQVLGTLDGELLATLSAAHVLPEAVWVRLQAEGSRP